MDVQKHLDVKNGYLGVMGIWASWMFSAILDNWVLEYEPQCLKSGRFYSLSFESDMDVQNIGMKEKIGCLGVMGIYLDVAF